MTVHWNVRYAKFGFILSEKMFLKLCTNLC